MTYWNTSVHIGQELEIGKNSTQHFIYESLTAIYSRPYKPIRAAGLPYPYPGPATGLTGPPSGPPGRAGHGPVARVGLSRAGDP
jgi:hypothetical protein